MQAIQTNGMRQLTGAAHGKAPEYTPSRVTSRCRSETSTSRRAHRARWPGLPERRRLRRTRRERGSASGL